jgi:hypothetical protein
VKDFYPGQDEVQLSIHDLLEHGVTFLNLIDGHSVDGRSLVIRLWTEDLMTLSEWKRSGHAKTLYDPGPVASDTALSWIIGFRTDPVAFKWTKRESAWAITCLENDEGQEEDIAKIIGRTTKEFRSFLEQQIRKSHV